MSFDWQSVVQQIAPTLGRTLQGPLSGVGVKFLADKLLADTTGMTSEDVVTALSSAIEVQTPDVLQKILQADGAFQKAMSDMGIKTDLLDVADARAREKALHDRTPSILAGAITVGLFSIICVMLFHPIPVESINIVNIMLGSLSTAWMSVVGYYFGSIKGLSTPNINNKKP